MYGAHGYLPAQFLSPFYNQRDDEYGGSFENRARFWREAIEAVREAVGGDCAVAVRIGIDPTARGPATRPRRPRRSSASSTTIVDLWDVNTSVIGEPWLDMRPSRLAPQGYQLEAVAEVRSARRSRSSVSAASPIPEQMAAAVRPGRST